MRTRILIIFFGVQFFLFYCGKAENKIVKKTNSGKMKQSKPVYRNLINKREIGKISLENYNSKFTIRNTEIKDNNLVIRVCYGGGCRKHDFKLIWSGKYLESKPIQAYLYLYHNSNNDNCEAKINQTLYFKLNLLPCIITIKGDKSFNKKLRYRLD